MKVYIGADHGGFALKGLIKEWLSEWGFEVEDVGAGSFVNTDDYPVFAFKVADKVSRDPGSRGILVCRSGGGMAIAANKVKGVRAVAVEKFLGAEHAVTNNNANIISLASDWTDEEEAKKIVKSFLTTKFLLEERHLRRIKQIEDYENQI